MKQKIICEASVNGLMNRLVSEGMPAEAVVIYRARNVVAKLPDAGVNIKSYKVPGLIKGLIYGNFRKPKAERAYTNALELQRLGIYTPKPLGYLIETRRGILRRTYYVSRQLEGWSELRGTEKRSDFAALVTALAGFVLKMHQKGVLMKDLTPGNVLFRSNGTDYEFALVDINRMEFGVTGKKLLTARLGLMFDSEDAGVIFARKYADMAGMNPEEAAATAARAFRNRWKFIRRKQRLRVIFGIRHH